MFQTTNRLPAIAAALFAGSLCSNAAVLFQDDFSGLVGDNLNGTTPDVTQGTTAWVADTEYKADGSGEATPDTNPSIRAYLTLGSLIDDNRGNADAIYTLSATVSVTAGTSGQWHAIGFWDNDTPPENFGSNVSGSGTAEGTAWMLRRDNAELRVFRGVGTGGGIGESTASPNNAAGTVDLQVVLDLSDWNGIDNWGSVTYFAKLSSVSTYTEIAAGELDAANSTFQAVGIGGGLVAADFDSFELSQIPEPSSLGLLGIAGVSLLMRRRRQTR
ncbi:PEP-CTERM sorting domain-containing protein [Haloferula sp. A504]|uniref:PEP-CTERM sorting domain-containing protein n=1 Tax=Haloferula sp. A504 TaxID=3373601 RepID=UPI0031C6C8B0|nr:PEP-CTERM sorting domain-containing protein [Verrucomicrobiaceae bacterium E54]